MNSMFSAFDAMCAEIMGKKFTADSSVSYVCNRSKRKNSAPSGAGGQIASSLKKDEKAANSATKQPRFALELDGIHCFETIVRS
ncbi:hypothetical protein EUTSA_v10009742mg [Eutrema salsugineum]|uniref:Uncharacterized protein n=1 Tax=Eutrema salsugineum TaxID=72664 RepID=V4L1D3_EUTSA|nr:uncharacterized protein LOC18991792 [Eutrema salsugineum]ESQ33533.1 hypothetical protein EUTSA_v10009742mg [Eutrema salsugineum]